MPLFEYVCGDCRAAFEQIVSSHRTEVECPRCGSPKVEKQLSVFAVTARSDDGPPAEAGSCGRCGAPEPGMCQM